MTDLNPHVFSSVVPVRWGDFDRYGHITNSAYVELAQEARMEHGYGLFDKAGLEMPAVVVRKLEVEYFRPILPGTQQVVVETSVTHVGNSSLATRQEIKGADRKVACVVEVVSVAVDIDSGRARPLSEAERAVLEAAVAPTV